MSKQDIDIQDQIYQYISGQMSGEKLEDFEKNLATNPVLRLRVERFRKIVFGLEANIIKDQLREMHDEGLTSANRQGYKWIYAIAASILLLLIFWFINPVENGDSLEFKQYFEPFPDLISVRNIDESSLAKGMKIYVAGDYKLATEFLSQQTESEDHEVHRRFYLGICYLATDKSEEAIQVFSELFKVPNVYTQQIQWYLGLSYWHNGNINEAKRVLERIQATEFEYENASKILRFLNSN